MFIFARCLRSSAAVTPAKYELDIIQVTTVLIIRKKWENNGTEKTGLVTPTPELGHHCASRCYSTVSWHSADHWVIHMGRVTEAPLSCYLVIAKLGNKTTTPPWSDPYVPPHCFVDDDDQGCNLLCEHWACTPKIAIFREQPPITWIPGPKQSVIWYTPTYITYQTNSPAKHITKNIFW